MKVPAKIHFEVPHVSKKHIEQSEWKTVVIALIDGSITQYYSWFIYKRFGLKLVQPLRGGHITFVSDRTELISNYSETKAQWNNKVVEVQLNLDYKTNGKHWWLRAECSAFTQIRSQLGLAAPFYSFHMSIGYTNESNLAQSLYAYQLLLNES
jgi:hypothetical protein